MNKLKKNDFVILPGNYDGGDYARVVEIVNGFATLEWWWDGALRTSSVEVGADTYERVNDDVNGWLRRTHRKGPYKLYSSEPYDKGYAKGMTYTVIFKDRGKVRIGGISDGSYARYGIATFGALSFPEVTGLWQSCAGAVSEDQLDLMIQFWHDECELPDWSVTQLKNVKW